MPMGVRLPPQALFIISRRDKMDIVVTFPGNKKVSADYNGFTIDSDQSKIEGGDGSAPSPFDLFLASIANCAASYVIYFCESRNIPTDNIRLIQKMDRDKESEMLKKIHIRVELPEDFPEKYKRALLNSVELCSVKKNIIKAPEFELSTFTKK